ncbi:MAG TPA: hypothetical protein PLL66_05325 [Bacteroidales bacterium]|nr:hypothetical protein [Bacteroidales bacterium]
MKIKPKPWHKIVKIGIACILAVLILLNTILTNYLRKSIEKSYSALLHSEVIIDNLNINYFTGTIKLFDILIIGKNEFKSDTLLSIDKLVFKKPEYDKENKTVVINELRVINLRMNNITSKDGKSCWDIDKQGKGLIEDETLGDFKFFVEKFVCDNLALCVINRQTNESQRYTDINLDINSINEGESVISTINAEGIIDNGKSKTNKLALSGTTKYNDKDFEAKACLEYNDFPIDIDVFIVVDSLSHDISHLNLKTDFSKLPKHKNVETSGIFEIGLSSAGVFNKDFDFNFRLNLFADNINFINHKNKSSLSANFKTEISYAFSAKEIFSLISNDMILTSGSDTLRGFINFNATDTLIYANSDILGNFDSNVFNSIFEDETFLTGIKIQSSSNLNGILDEHNKQLNGQYITDIEISNPDFNIPEMNITFLKNNFEIDSYIVSKYLTGKLVYSINEIQNLYNNSTIKQNINIDISKLYLPMSKGAKPEFIPNFKPKSNFSFAQNTETEVLFNIDSIIIKDKVLENLHSEIKSTPDEFCIYNINLDIEDAKLCGEFSLINEPDYIISQNSFNLKNLDLAYFAESDQKISGIVNFVSNNTIYSSKDDIEIPLNQGLNTLLIENFKLKTGTLKSYKIDEEFIDIKRAEITAILDGDSLIIEPTQISINDADVNLKANFNILTDSISLFALLDIPDKYVSSEVKLLISLFASNEDLDLPRKTGRMIYLLKISGPIEKPEYNIYK